MNLPTNNFLTVGNLKTEKTFIQPKSPLKLGNSQFRLDSLGKEQSKKLSKFSHNENDTTLSVLMDKQKME